MSATESGASELFGDKLLTKEGECAASEALRGKRFVGVYFSAHWCPPCRSFTPLLAAFYDSVVEEDEDALEIVFVSSDQSESEFQSYYKTMPWTALPLTSSLKSTLSSKFGVRGIPMLVILDGATGAVKSINGRGDVSAYKTAPTKCLEQWAANDVVEDMGGDSWGCNIL